MLIFYHVSPFLMFLQFFFTFNLEQNSTEFSLGLTQPPPPPDPPTPRPPDAFNTTTYVPSKILMLNKTRFAARSPKKTYSNDRTGIGIASEVVRALMTL